ncbi:MAG: hypothetical protein RL257_724 [Actinomycetota bacterium]|jgi:NAD(P)-dependent dehydrogenase (short-subunit alcohol dehydrogenase family)
MSFKIENTPDLKGSIALVTGGNIGLGFETAKALALKGASVVLAARNEEKGRQAVSRIRQEISNAQIQFLQLDLASQSNIKLSAESFSQEFSKLDILVNNAGIMAMPERRTEDGFESQFGVNHLGHWSLTGLLIPKILLSTSPRIVTVTSSAHHLIRKIDFENPHMDGKYSAWNAYSQSKLANYFFSLGLAELFENKSLNAKSLLAHPGLAHTNLQIETYDQGASGFVGWLSKVLAANVGQTPQDGALPQIRAALDPKAKNGEFYAPRYFVSGAPVKRPFLRLGNSKNIEKLWALSERETGISIDI